MAVYRLGAHIPTPGINADALASFFNSNSGSALGLLDLFNGGNLRKLTIFALGIMPYITASIIFQLLTVIYEPLAKLQKEGEDWTPQDHAVDPLCHRAAGGGAELCDCSLAGWNSQTGTSMVTISKTAFVPLCIITLTCGTAFIMWLGEQITDRGIGNGMSLSDFHGHRGRPAARH